MAQGSHHNHIVRLSSGAQSPQVNKDPLLRQDVPAPRIWPFLWARCTCVHEPQLWELLGIVLRVGTDSSTVLGSWCVGPCVMWGSGWSMEVSGETQKC